MAIIKRLFQYPEITSKEFFSYGDMNRYIAQTGILRVNIINVETKESVIILHYVSKYVNFKKD